MSIINNEHKIHIPDLDIDRIFQDYPYYCEKLLRIKTKSKGIAPLAFNNIQKLMWYGRPPDFETNPIYKYTRLDEGMVNKFLREEPLRYIILKYRQAGVSTFFTSFAFWRTHTNPGHNSLIVAHDLKTTKHLFNDMCKVYYQFLDYRVKPKTNTKNMYELEFKDPKGGLGLESIISTATAGHAGSGHGHTFHTLILCLGGDSLIELANGSHIPIRNVQVGDLVRTHKGNIAPVIENVKRLASDISKDGKIIKITPYYSNESITCTPDHPIFTPQGWKKAGELKIGDEVGYCRKFISSTKTHLPIRTISSIRPQGGGKQPIEGELELNEEVGFFVGYYLAEGCILYSSKEPYRAGSIHLSRHRNEFLFAERACEAVEKYTSSIKHGDEKHCLTSFSILYGAALAQTIEREFGHKDNKHIPEWVFEAGEDFCRGILAGYMAGDGSKTCTRYITFTSIRKQILIQLRYIAYSLGMGWMSLYRKNGDFIDKRGWNCKETWVSVINDNFTNYTSKKRREPKYREENAIIWVKIKKIEEGKIDYVYDICLEHEDHSFHTVAGIVSNSEIARWPNYESLEGLTQTVPTGEDSVGTSIILESVAKISGDFFNQKYEAAVEGQSDYSPIFLPWYLHNEYRERIKPNGFELKEFWKDFMEFYSLKENQVWWYYKKHRELEDENPGRGMDKVRMLYPGNEQEAWMTTGYSAFPEEALNYLGSQCKDPIIYGDYTGDRFVFSNNKKGKLHIWEKPRGDTLYVVGSDISLGRGESESTFCVLAHPGYRQVAEWGDNTVDPKKMAYILKAIGEYYNNALIIVETNNAGILTNSTLDDIYTCGNLYEWEYFNRRGNTKSKATGWQTSQESKRILIGQANSLLAVTPPEVEIYSSMLINQMKNFIDYGNDVYQPAKNWRSDRCVKENTIIETKTGNKLVQDIQNEEEVLTHNGNLRKVKITGKREVKENLLSFTVNGIIDNLIVTREHPILIRKKKYNFNRKEWTEAGEIREGDLVFIPKRKNLPLNKLSNDELYLLGWYLADGYLSQKGQLKITFGPEEEYLAIILSQIIEKLIKDKEGGKKITIRKIPGRKENCLGWIDLTISNVWLKNFILKYCGRTKDKKIHEEIYYSQNTIPLIVGFLEGDGFQGGQRNSLSVSQKNNSLLKQIQRLLWDNGIWCTGHVNKRDMSLINIPTFASNKLLFLYEGNKYKIYDHLHEKNKRPYLQLETEDGFWTPISSIKEEFYQGKVYNFYVEEDNTYTANGVAVHNCIAWLLAVMAMWRKVARFDDFRDTTQVEENTPFSPYRDDMDMGDLGNERSDHWLLS